MRVNNKRMKWKSIETDHIFSATTPLIAAKKIFRVNKALANVSVYNVEDPEAVYKFRRRDISYDKIDHRKIKY
jgi:hypothetical protein